MTIGQNNDLNGIGVGRVDGNDRSLGELFKDLTTGIQALIGQELRLAKLEITQNLKSAQKGIVFGVVAGVLGLVGVIALAFTIGALLALILPVWASALIVTVIFLVAAGIAGLAAKIDLSQVNPKPEETIQTLKEDQEWLKQQIK